MTLGATDAAASAMTVRRLRCNSSESAAFSPSFRLMTSVKMIAASTMSPATTAKPPSVMTLMPSPKNGKSASPVRMESGIVHRTTRIVRSSRSVTSRTIMTMMTASRTTERPPSMDVAMKSAWRYASAWTEIPRGFTDAAKSASILSSSAVSAGVLPPGAFWIESTTASRPLKEALPRRGAPATCTSATSQRRREEPSACGSGVARMASSVSARAICLSGISSPPTLAR